MSSEGPKIGGGRYGISLEWSKNSKIWQPKVAATAAFSGPIRARPTTVGRKISRRWSSGSGAPPWPARVQG